MNGDIFIVFEMFKPRKYKCLLNTKHCYIEVAGYQGFFLLKLCQGQNHLNIRKQFWLNIKASLKNEFMPGKLFVKPFLKQTIKTVLLTV